MKLTLSLLFFTFFYSAVFSQEVTLSGKITDDQHKAIPFASIYIKNTTKGTSANIEGEYNLQLKPGNYEVQYKAVGYHTESRKVELNANKAVNVVLNFETYQLTGVTIKAGGEDPAYAIIRKAIRKRKAHLNEVSSYTAEVYIKGLQKLLAAPKRFMGVDIQKAARENGLDSNRRGIVYLSESESKYSFERPDKVHEELISSKVSGSNRAFSYNRATDLKVNFYENIQTWQNLSNRPLVSPIAENAMFYYNYKFIGLSVENGETVNKIQLIPKRGYDPCFQGYIYILEDSWRIYGLDLYITSKQNINFVDTLHVNQQFFPVGQNTWMPSSIKFEFTGGLFGFKFGGYFISIYKDYDLNPTFTKKEFNEVLRITKGINKKDSIFWENERPIPLTEEEKTDYKKKEVLAKKRESKPYLDSLDKRNNKFSPVKLLLRGYQHSNRYEHEFYNVESILGALHFNTVQGYYFDFGASFRKQIDTINNRFLFIGARLGYGFSDHKFRGSANVVIPAGSFTLGFRAGSEIVDLNNTNAITPSTNAFYSLFEKQNAEKFYQKQFISASISKRIVGGWLASAVVEYADKTWVPNTSAFSYFNPENRNYTSNNPFTPAQEIPLFQENQSFKIGFRTTYNFSNKYETYPNGRRYIQSKYPTVGFSYTKGVKNFLGSSVDYDLISADVSKSDISLGVFGNTSFFIGAGKFLNSNNLFFPDYKHFSGNELFIYHQGINTFLLLDYYKFSTNTQYLEGHWEHNFSGFILNKIPLIRKAKLQEILDVNYLSTPSLKNYSEVGVGLQYLSFRLMYGHSFNSGTNITSAIRLALNL
jgi:hypothetical protein